MFSGRQTSPPKEATNKPENTFADLQSASKVADSLKKLEAAITEQVCFHDSIILFKTDMIFEN